MPARWILRVLRAPQAQSYLFQPAGINAFFVRTRFCDIQVLANRKQNSHVGISSRNFAVCVHDAPASASILSMGSPLLLGRLQCFEVRPVGPSMRYRCAIRRSCRVEIPSRSAAMPGYSSPSTTACMHWRRSSSRMLIVTLAARRIGNLRVRKKDRRDCGLKHPKRTSELGLKRTF